MPTPYFGVVQSSEEISILTLSQKYRTTPPSIRYDCGWWTIDSNHKTNDNIEDTTQALPDGPLEQAMVEKEYRFCCSDCSKNEPVCCNFSLSHLFIRNIRI